MSRGYGVTGLEPLSYGESAMPSKEWFQLALSPARVKEEQNKQTNQLPLSLGWNHSFFESSGKERK